MKRQLHGSTLPDRHFTCPGSHGRTASTHAMRRSALPWLLVVALCLAGCSRQTPPNIVLIVIDTLRADRVGAYGNTRGLTSFADTLAARGTVFQHAYSQCSWTNPSVASIVTSRYQSQHGIITFESVLADSEVTLAEELKKRGYQTGFFSANGLISKRMHFDQGYDAFKSLLVKGPDAPPEERIPERTARINQEAMKWLDGLAQSPNKSAPVFLHIHYMEPHHPYAPLPEGLAHVASAQTPPSVERANATAFFGHLVPLEPDVLQNLKDVYDAEVFSVDMGLRALFKDLEQRHILDNAIVVLTADHGEEFKEHGLIGHEKTLYEEVVHVPLIMLVPGHSEHEDIDQVVGLVDVTPTLIDMAGGTLSPTFEGHSWKQTLAPEMRGWFAPGGNPPPAGPGVAYTELIKGQERDEKRFTPHQHAVIAGKHKLIVGLHDEHEYYDLAADPGELNANALSEPERNQLLALYESIRSQAKENAAPRDKQQLDADTKERMRQLGYDH
jgi:arylsulfatase A-like enzyme